MASIDLRLAYLVADLGHRVPVLEASLEANERAQMGCSPADLPALQSQHTALLADLVLTQDQIVTGHAATLEGGIAQINQAYADVVLLREGARQGDAAEVDHRFDRLEICLNGVRETLLRLGGGGPGMPVASDPTPVGFDGVVGLPGAKLLA